MHERQQRAVMDQQASTRAYVQEATGTKSVADELRGLAELRDSGVISAEDYARARAKVLS